MIIVTFYARTPDRAPNANADAERWVRSARTECLDQLLVASEQHLRRVLTEYVAYDNRARPHQGPAQRCPVALPAPMCGGPMRRRDRLGGLLHDYYRGAAGPGACAPDGGSARYEEQGTRTASLAQRCRGYGAWLGAPDGTSLNRLRTPTARVARVAESVSGEACQEGETCSSSSSMAIRS